MNNNFKVKKGSSLVMVLIIMSILSVLGTAILSVTLSSYKMRKMNGTLKTNFYGAEAGLDKAYGIVGNVVDDAIEAGNTAVESAKDSLEETIENEKLKLLAGDTSDLKFVNTDGSVKEEEIKKFQNNTFQTAYKEYIKDNLASKLGDTNEYEFDRNGTGEKFNTDGTKPSISPNIPTEFTNDNKMDIELVSTFKHDNLEKQVQAIYEITVPEYKSVYYIENNIIKIPENLAFLKGIAVDGDMKVENSNVNITGDVFVKGKNVDDNGQITDRNEFESGIILDSSNVSVTGELSSAQNIFLKESSSNFEVTGDAYVRNAIIDTNAEESNLNINKVDISSGGSLFTMDDLELNGSKSQVNIQGGFYGVSDGSASEGNNHSSSIIVNAEDIGSGSFINIETSGEDDKVIIAGSSYIQLYNNKEYQTGESVSIKGNYKAYTMPLIKGDPKNEVDGKSLHESNIKFEYKDPLILATHYLKKLDNDDDELDVFDKSYYFKHYHNEYKDDDDYKLNLGGSGIKIKEDKILSATGAVLCSPNENTENKILVGKYSIDAPEEVIAKSNQLKRNIFYMGDSNIADTDLANTSTLQQMVKYSNSKGKVDFSSITDKFEGKNTQDKIDNNSDVILLDRGKSYVFAAQDADTSSISGNAEIVTVEKQNDTAEFRGIIITAGDVYFCGKIKFKGTIICGGNLIFKDSSLKEITYDEEYVKRLIGYNYEDFKNIFQNNLDNKFEIEAETSVGRDKDDSVKSDIIRDKLISRKRWKIIK